MKKNWFFKKHKYLLSYAGKILKVMKLTTFLTILTSLQLLAVDNFAQTQRLSLNVSNESIQNVLEIIENETDYFFFYNSQGISLDKRVSLNLSDKSISDVLNRLFEGENISYTISNRQIILAGNEFQALQQRKVTGKVTDASGEPLPGVTVLIKGTTNGTVTNFDGEYTIANVPEGATLQFSFVGMKSQEIVVGSQTSIDVVLQADAIGIEEVVAVGYGTQKKINLTGAISQVKSTEFIEERPVTSVGQALQGVIPGLTVSKPNGIPGEGHSYNIRGLTSLNGGSPLVLVDGTEMDPNLVPPEDIESISVLKDAASAAIYGARASFGVILIKTKSGKRDKEPVFTYTGNASWSTPTMMPEKVDPVTQIKTGLIQWENAGRTPGWYWGRNVQTWLDLYEEGTHLNSGKWVDGVWYPLGDNNDMLDFMVEPSWSTTHNLSVTAGSKSTTYYLSAGLMENDGIIVFDKDKYSRKNILGKIDTDINSWLSLGATLGFTRGVQKMPYIPNNPGYMYNVSYIRPTFWLTGIDEVSGAPWGFSPEMVRLGAQNSTLTDNTNIQTRITLKPVAGLEVNGTYSFRRIIKDDSYHVNTYEMANTTDGSGITFKYRNDPNSLRKTASFNDYNNLTLTGTYTKVLADIHNFKLMLGYSQEDSRASSYWAERQKLISDDIPSLNLATGNQVADDAITTWALRSGFARLNYNYKGKYLLELVSRYDGSSRFNKDDRFVYSPSGSLGWIVSEESFMADTDNWLNYLKVRASYGSQGNQEVGAYAYIPSMSTGSANWIIDGEKPLYVKPGGLVSESFTWEKVVTSNLGIDFGFFDGKLMGTAEVYTRETIGMLTPAEELPAILGTSAPEENASDLKVSGWEFSLNWQDKVSNDFSYRVGVTLYDNKAKITKFDGNPTGQISNYYVGKEIGEIWGYETDRLFQEEDFITDSEGNRSYAPGIPTQDIIFSNRVPYPGDVKYKNLNGDDKIDYGDNTLANHGDKKIIGNSSSRYQYGIRLGATYKKFDFSMFFQGVAKKDLWTSGEFGFTSGAQWRTIFAHTMDYWTPENTDAFYPRPDDRSYNKQPQTRYLLDAAYLRLKNVKLSYTIPESFVNRVGVSSAKIFISGENLFLISGLPKGIDPELGTSNTYPLRKDFAIGASISF